MENFDEIICFNEKNENISRIELILYTFEEVLQSEDFIISQNEFIDKNCHFFVDGEDLPPECMNLYGKYVEIIENKLLSKVLQKYPDFKFEELTPLFESKYNDFVQHAEILELLSAALDFNEFRDLMVSFNKGSEIEFNDLITNKKI